MGSKNPDQNRLDLQQARQAQSSLGVEFRSILSTDKNVFTTQSCATPEYKLWQRKEVSSADASDPNNTAPNEEDSWNLQGYMGLHGYLAFDGGTTPEASLELWARNPERDEWFLVDTKAGVGEFVEFHFDNKIRHRTVFVRIASLTLSGASHVDIICSPE